MSSEFELDNTTVEKKLNPRRRMNGRRTSTIQKKPVKHSFVGIERLSHGLTAPSLCITNEPKQTEWSWRRSAHTSHTKCSFFFTRCFVRSCILLGNKLFDFALRCIFFLREKTPIYSKSERMNFFMNKKYRCTHGKHFRRYKWLSNALFDRRKTNAMNIRINC